MWDVQAARYGDIHDLRPLLPVARRRYNARMQCPDFASAAATLRSSHPKVPALDVLDPTMQGHEGSAVDLTGPWLAPGSPFCQVLAAALDQAFLAVGHRQVFAVVVKHQHAWRAGEVKGLAVAGDLGRTRAPASGMVLFLVQL